MASSKLAVAQSLTSCRNKGMFLSSCFFRCRLWETDGGIPRERDSEGRDLILQRIVKTWLVFQGLLFLKQVLVIRVDLERPHFELDHATDVCLGALHGVFALVMMFIDGGDNGNPHSAGIFDRFLL